MLRDQPDLLFLDIGCNIGTYTIAMAHLGRTVVAVDALIDNLQLLNKSLLLGNFQKYVTLNWNAVSDTHTTPGLLCAQLRLHQFWRNMCSFCSSLEKLIPLTMVQTF